MPFHDLNIPRPADAAELQQTLAFLAELGYGVVAVSITVSGKLPAAPTPLSLPISNVPQSLTLLTRLNLVIIDPAQNHRITSLQSAYNILALRPANEKALSLCCQSLECDVISIDFSQRLPFLLKFKTVAAALQRGVRFEICYSAGLLGGNDARRNLISGASALIRATRGRGIIISSDARNALGLRGPCDLVNLATVWGLKQERGKEAVCEEAAKVVKLARLRRESYRGVVEIIDSGVVKERNATIQTSTGFMAAKNAAKRKAVEDLKQADSLVSTNTTEEILSKREQKRRAKKARLDINGTT